MRPTDERRRVLNNKRNKLECALSGDAKPRRLERQSCSGWHHTMGQLLYEVSRKYHLTFSFDSALCKWGWLFIRNYILWHPPHSGILLIHRQQPYPYPKPNLWPFEPKTQHIVEDYYCAKFQVILIRGFRFIVLAYVPTYKHTHTYRDKVIAISAPPYYVVGTYNIIDSSASAISVFTAQCVNDSWQRHERQKRAIESSLRRSFL